MLTSAQSAWLRTLGVMAGGSAVADTGAELPRPMTDDCKILRGRVPGPAHHVLCATHNHVLDTTAKTIIATSIEDYAKRFPARTHETVAHAGKTAAVPATQPAIVPSPTPQEAVATANTDLAAAAAERKRLIARIEVAKRDTFAAFDRYQDQKKVSDDQWIISGLSRAAKEVTTLGDFEDPGPELKRILDELRSSARNAIAALGADDLATADGICTRLDAMAVRAQKLAHCYSEDLIDGAETAKTTVKVVDTGAKVVGGVALTVATGGAAAGVVAAEVVGTATAISVAGGVAASTAGVATKLALGEKVDWGMFSIDILMQGLLARFGGKLTEGVAAAVAQRLGPAAATLGGAVIKNLAAQAVMHVNTTMSKTALETAYGKLSGRDLTLQQVYDSYIAQLTDPSSLLVAAATAAAQGHVDAKLAASSAAAEKAGGGSEEIALPSADEVVKAIEDLEAGRLTSDGELIQLGPHGAASRNRAELEVSGKEVESAHLGPQAVMKKNVVDYNADHALTILLEKSAHKGMDAPWKDDFKAMRKAGETTATAQTVFDTVARAIEKAPGLRPGQKKSLVAALTDEMFMQRGLKPTDVLELPYPNIKPKAKN